MPVQTGPLGPFPEGADPEEYEKLRRRVLWKMPSGLYVLGAVGDGGASLNAMTLSWATQVSSDPKLVGVSVEKAAYTHGLVDESGVFVLNIIAREDRAIVRKFTKPVEVDRDAATLNGFDYVIAGSGAPVLARAVAWLDAGVRQRVDCGAYTLFVGEVLDCAFRAPEDTEVLRMEDTRLNYGG